MDINFSTFTDITFYIEVCEYTYMIKLLNQAKFTSLFYNVIISKSSHDDVMNTQLSLNISVIKIFLIGFTISKVMSKKKLMLTNIHLM